MAVTPEQKQAAIEKAKATVAAKKLASAAEAPAPVGLKELVRIRSKHSLREPYLNIWFHPGVVSEPVELTSWIQSQVDAKLFEII